MNYLDAEVSVLCRAKANFFSLLVFFFTFRRPVSRLCLSAAPGVDLYLGLIDYPIIGKIVTQEVLSCSSIAAGSTTPATLPPPSDFGNDSPEQVYVFESTVSQHVSFSTCDSADYNSLIRVLDAYFSEMDNNDDGEGCGEYTSYLEIFLEANQQFFVVVEGSAVTEWGSFNLSVAC